MPTPPTVIGRGVAALGDSVHLLSELAPGSVDCAYLDPPYGTGRTFYNYADPTATADTWGQQLREMLHAVKRTLAPTGVIWLHLDRFGFHHGKLALDEVFGTNNALGVVTWQRTSSAPRTKGIASTTDFILVSGGPKAQLRRQPRDERVNREYRNPDGDPKGPWRPISLTTQDATGDDGRLVPSVYGIEHPTGGHLLHPPTGGHWARTQERMIELFAGVNIPMVVAPADVAVRAAAAGVDVSAVRPEVGDLRLGIPLDEARARLASASGVGAELLIRDYGLARKAWLADMPGMQPGSVWTAEEAGSTTDAKRHLKALLPGAHPFATPKPELLLAKIIECSTDPGQLVIDPYAGSGTTAAVAEKLGRRWITAELEEDTFTNILLPRLRQAADGTDQGGVSVREHREAVHPLPDGITANDAVRFTTLLNRFTETTDIDASAVAKLRRSALTRIVRTPAGGGVTPHTPGTPEQRRPMS